MNRNVYRTICSVILVALFLGAGITLRMHTQAQAAAGVPVLTHKTSSSSWASASPLPFPSWWSGTCDSGHHPGSYQLGSASYRGLVACGPLPTRGANDVRVYFPGAAIYVNEWECVELSMRYLYLAYGVAPYLADGSQVVWNYPGSLLQKIHNDTPGQAPQAGDVLSYGATSTRGHTSIVMSANYASPGNGTITVLEENNSSDGQSVLQVSNWHVRSTNGSGVKGWLHDPRSANPSVVGMAPTHDSKGYQIIGADGSLSAFGDAINYGSLKGLPLNAPVVGMAATPDGMGYWLVAADGGIFPFGDAQGLGSLA